jgi:hypothetical protein
MCRSICRGDGDECEGVGVTSSDGGEFFVCTPGEPIGSGGSAGGSSGGPSEGSSGA